MQMTKPGASERRATRLSSCFAEWRIRPGLHWYRMPKPVYTRTINISAFSCCVLERDRFYLCRPWGP